MQLPVARCRVGRHIRAPLASPKPTKLSVKFRRLGLRRAVHSPEQLRKTARCPCGNRIGPRNPDPPSSRSNSTQNMSGQGRRQDQNRLQVPDRPLARKGLARRSTAFCTNRRRLSACSNPWDSPRLRGRRFTDARRRSYGICLQACIPATSCLVSTPTAPCPQWPTRSSRNRNRPQSKCKSARPAACDWSPRSARTCSSARSRRSLVRAGLHSQLLTI